MAKFNRRVRIRAIAACNRLDNERRRKANYPLCEKCKVPMLPELTAAVTGRVKKSDLKFRCPSCHQTQPAG